jgi:hypothetical protein
LRRGSENFGRASTSQPKGTQVPEPIHEMPCERRREHAFRLGASIDGHFHVVCRELGLNPYVASSDPLSAIAIARAEQEYLWKLG